MFEIKTFAPTSHKIKALIYGDSWSWKTSFGATAPNVIFASAEAWLLSVWNRKVDYVEIKTINDLRDLFNYLKKWEHKYETVVIDSITEINDIIKMELEAKRGRALQLQDWQEVAKQIEAILRNFRGLDMHVIMIAQEQVERDEQKIVKYTPSLNWKTATKIAYFMDIVWHIETTPTWEHLISTEPSPKYLTKDRTWKLWNWIAADFNLWTLAVESLELEDEEVVYQSLGEKEMEEPPKPALPQKAPVTKTPATKPEPQKTTPEIWEKETEEETKEPPKTAPMAKPMAASKKQIDLINDLYTKYAEIRGDKAMALNDIIAKKYSLGWKALQGLNDLTIKFASDLIKTLQEQVK